MKYGLRSALLGLALTTCAATVSFAQSGPAPLGAPLEGQIGALMNARNVVGLTPLVQGNTSLAPQIAGFAAAQSPNDAVAIALAAATGAPDAAAAVFEAVALAAPAQAVAVANAMAAQFPEAGEAIRASLARIQAALARQQDVDGVTVVDDTAENPNTASRTTL